MKLALSALVLFALGFQSNLSSQVKQEWAVMYENKSYMSMDRGGAITVDDQGNTYVAGNTWVDIAANSDYAILKYDKDGNLLWSQVYNGPGNYKDSPFAITHDSYGNVYVTGGSSGDDTAADICTIKYGPDGTQAWIARYTGTGEGHKDEAYSIEVDNAGNVYVSGQSVHIAADGSAEDFITIKYDPSGNELWVVAYDDGISRGKAKAMTIDGAGNVYVTGRSKGPDYDFATVKYNTDGVQQWVAKFDGESKTGYDEPVDIGVDGAGNVYVTGFTYNKNKKYDYCTIKYSPDGKEEWVATYRKSADMNYLPVSLEVDQAGNVFVTGSAKTGMTGGDEYVTVKYNTTGNLEWASVFDALGEEKAMSMTMDKAGNVYVTGAGTPDLLNLMDLATVKYDTDGNELWKTYYNFEGSSIEEGRGVYVDDNGNVYVTGITLGANSGKTGIVTVKYSQK